VIREAIEALVSGHSLTSGEAASVMEEVMQGEATPAQLGAFVTALRMKGETVDEIVGLVRAMMSNAIRISVDGPVLDTCGTGGDGRGSFNISTAAAFVAAGAGLRVAKHGNRAMSSRCGSADVLEALGVKMDLVPEQVKTCVQEVGIGFLFAPVFHPAMRFAAAPRREIGIRTVFNILGPLCNPAGATSQLLGVADEGLLEKMALVLRGLGCRHAVVVHGGDGLDEVTTTGATRICELKDGEVRGYSVTAEELGLERAGPESLSGGALDENAAILRGVLEGRPGPRRDVVLANAAAALLAGDSVQTLADGVSLAAKTVDGGHALAKLERLVELTGSLSVERAA
jgi:anthranilate phosphoribosyltransferase